MNLEQAYHLSLIIVLCGVFQASLENLILVIRQPILLNFEFSTPKLFSKRLSFLYFFSNSPGIWILIVVKTILVLFLLISTLLSEFYPILTLGIILIDFLGIIRMKILPMSDYPLQRAIIVASSIHYFFSDPNLSLLGLIFVFTQLCLAYISSGVHKVNSSAWRNGFAMKKFLVRYFPIEDTNVQGFSKHALKHIGWLVILFELLFPISIFHPNLLFIFIGFGFMFHTFLWVGCAINFFFWTFIATYPIVYFLSQKITEYYYL